MSSLRFIPGEGSGVLCLLGEAPGAAEEELGRPFVGQSGQLLRGIITELGYDLSQIYITNCVKIRPDENRTPHVFECDSWLPVLEAELRDMQYVIAVGQTAHMVLMRNREKFRHLKTYHIYHPAYILRNMNKLQDYKFSIKQVLDEIYQPVPTSCVSKILGS